MSTIARPTLTPAEYRTHLEADIEAMQRLAAHASAAPVATCPGWSVGDVLGHTAGIYAFATAQLIAGPTETMAEFDPPAEDTPEESLAVAAAGLLAAMDHTDPNELRPNWHRHPTADWYWRRMAHETAVHRADVALAIGGDATIDTMLAVDGVNEFCDTFLSKAKRRGIVGMGETVHLHATDVDDDVSGRVGAGEWMFTFSDEGVSVAYTHGKGDMAARGTASDLLLFVWNRRPVDLVTFGDTDVTEWWPSKVTI